MQTKLTREQAIALYDELVPHLDAIGNLFKRPAVTLVVRDPQLPDGELVLTSDSENDIIAAIKKQMAKKPVIERTETGVDIRHVI